MKLNLILPAYAGVIPLRGLYLPARQYSSRVCGGDPDAAGYGLYVVIFFPRMRG